MKLLAGKLYDPGTAASVSTASLLAMTAIDTTNLRLTFTAPSNGTVMVRARAPMSGASSSAQILLGVLDGSTVKCRMAPAQFSKTVAAAAVVSLQTATMLVTGLTPGTSYTWDLAYGVEFAVASTVIKYGGPNDSSNATAWGGISFEIWDTQGLLAGTLYDPSTADTSKNAAAAVAMTALDTTNLRLTFVAPSSGNVYVRLRGVISGTTVVTGTQLLGVLDGATVRGRSRTLGGVSDLAASVPATSQFVLESSFLIAGLTGGTSYSFDAAYGVETAQGSAVFKWGGPDNTTQDDAWGGFAFEIWNPDSLPRAIGSAS